MSNWDMLKDLYLLYLSHPEGLTDMEAADLLGVHRTTINSRRKELGAVEVSYARYTIQPTENDYRLAQAIIKRYDPKN